MKKNVTLLLVIAALAVAGCRDKPKIKAPQNAVVEDQAIPAGSGKKSTVAQTMSSNGYTYVEAVDDKGEKTWLAMPERQVEVGDKIEYLETPPMMNYESKAMKKKFDKILFVTGVKIVK